MMQKHLQAKVNLVNLMMTLVVLLPSVRGQDDTCRYARDGECDEPRYCRSGTDCSDCGSCSGIPCAAGSDCTAIGVPHTINSRAYPTLCMNVFGGVLRDDTQIGLWTCSRSHTEVFTYMSDHTIRPTADLTLCMEYHSETGMETLIKLAACRHHGTYTASEQQFCEQEQEGDRTICAQESDGTIRLMANHNSGMVVEHCCTPGSQIKLASLTQGAADTVFDFQPAAPPPPPPSGTSGCADTMQECGFMQSIGFACNSDMGTFRERFSGQTLQDMCPESCHACDGGGQQPPAPPPPGTPQCTREEGRCTGGDCMCSTFGETKTEYTTSDGVTCWACRQPTPPPPPPQCTSEEGRCTTSDCVCLTGTIKAEYTTNDGGTCWACRPQCPARTSNRCLGVGLPSAPCSCGTDGSIVTLRAGRTTTPLTDSTCVVGATVRILESSFLYTSCHGCDDPSNPIDVDGVITSCSDEAVYGIPVAVQWSNGYTGHSSYQPSELRLSGNCYACDGGGH